MLVQSVTAKLAAVAVAMDDPGIKPNQGGLPGVGEAKNIVGALLVYGLIACVAGCVISAIIWAVGGSSSNPSLASRGKSGVVISFAAAIVVGAANALITFGSGIGGKV